MIQKRSTEAMALEHFGRTWTSLSITGYSTDLGISPFCTCSHWEGRIKKSKRMNNTRCLVEQSCREEPPASRNTAKRSLAPTRPSETHLRHDGDLSHSLTTSSFRAVRRRTMGAADERGAGGHALTLQFVEGSCSASAIRPQQPRAEPVTSTTVPGFQTL